jgi:hypothetical protein
VTAALQVEGVIQVDQHVTYAVGDPPRRGHLVVTTARAAAR